ncbi:MAG: DUF424 family protein [Candidatus Woesearchaeota archaeon]
MYAKKNITENNKVLLAICDDSVKGKVFLEDDVQIDCAGEYFNGERMVEEEIIRLCKSAKMITAVGQECVALLIREGFADKKNTKTVQGIPYAFVLFDE